MARKKFFYKPFSFFNLSACRNYEVYVGDELRVEKKGFCSTPCEETISFSDSTLLSYNLFEKMFEVLVARLDVWIAESKWWQKKKVGIQTVENLLQQAQFIREREGENLRIWIWLFAHDGVTAEALMREYNILWSTRPDLDALLTFVNLRTLPEI